MNRTRIDPLELHQAYVFGKRTLDELAETYQVSRRTIQRHLDSYTVNQVLVPPRPVVLITDTTYFGRKFGVMCFFDASKHQLVYHQYVKNETIQLYQAGLHYLTQQGFDIQAIVCDGKPGLISALGAVPVQLCQFHQIALISRYLTRKPKADAAFALKAISLKMKDLSKVVFNQMLLNWLEEHQAYYNEQHLHPETQKRVYTHKRLRSAYRSLNRNLDHLFTFEAYPHLNIPNTTNELEGLFSDLKTKLRNHNGLTVSRKKKFIDEFFRHKYRK